MVLNRAQARPEGTRSNFHFQKLVAVTERLRKARHSGISDPVAQTAGDWTFLLERWVSAYRRILPGIPLHSAHKARVPGIICITVQLPLAEFSILLPGLICAEILGFSKSRVGHFLTLALLYCPHAEKEIC